MAVTVRQLREFLEQFEDQDAVVQVVEHHCGTDYYEQGGRAFEVNFNPAEHVSYVDMRNNQFATEAQRNLPRTLLLGVTNY